MLNPTVKSKFILFCIPLIIPTLITPSLSNYHPKRFLQYNQDYNYYDDPYSNKYNNTSTDETSVAEDPGTFLLAWFVIFFLMALYIICVMKKYEDTRDKTDDIWKFLCFANNGILLISGINFINVKNLYIDSSPFFLSAIGFFIGCFYYIRKFIANCNMVYAIQYFQYDKIKELARIPSFIWNLQCLADNCCLCTCIPIRVYADGHTVSDFCWVCIWNFMIKCLKFFAVIFTIVSFYIFLAIYFIFWLFGKYILILIMKCRGERESDTNSVHTTQPNQNPPVNLPGNNMGNNVVINQGVDTNRQMMANPEDKNFGIYEKVQNNNAINNNNVPNFLQNNFMNKRNIIAPAHPQELINNAVNINNLNTLQISNQMGNNDGNIVVNVPNVGIDGNYNMNHPPSPPFNNNI